MVQLTPARIRFSYAITKAGEEKPFHTGSTTHAWVDSASFRVINLKSVCRSFMKRSLRRWNRRIDPPEETGTTGKAFSPSRCHGLTLSAPKNAIAGQTKIYHLFKQTKSTRGLSSGRSSGAFLLSPQGEHHFSFIAGSDAMERALISTRRILPLMVLGSSFHIFHDTGDIYKERSGA